MESTVIVTNEHFHWLDIVDPSEAELEAIATKYKLNQRSVHDCLDSEHLPKYERIENITFGILRGYDEACSHESDTVQELTRKVAIFFTDRFLITIHRKDQPYLSRVKSKWSRAGALNASFSDENLLSRILYDLISCVFSSYEHPIDQALDQLELLEMGVFEAQGAQPFEIKEGYYLKRKASVFKRMLRTCIDLLPKLTSGLQIQTGTPDYQNLRELADSYYFYSDELMESVNSLLNLHISLSSQRTNEASHRTNEVVRVLTIFSVFLLPLNVLTGIYGMNFEHIPELKWGFGYPMVLLMMVGVTGVIYFWFRKKGWLK